MRATTRASHRRRRIAVAVLLAGLGLSVAKVAQAKGFIEYLKPAPIACSPLSSASWGVAGVLPRDLCNGIESAKGAAVPPDFYYWDGQIIKAKDGKYHMFMSTWAGSAGFNPGWTELGCLPRHQQPRGAGALHAAGVRLHQQQLAQGAQRVGPRAAGRNATRSWSARSSPSPSTSRPRSTVRGRDAPPRSRPTASRPVPPRPALLAALATTPTTTRTSASSRAPMESSRSCSATGSSRSLTPSAVPTRCRSRPGPIPRPTFPTSTASTRSGPRSRA